MESRFPLAYVRYGNPLSVSSPGQNLLSLRTEYDISIKLPVDLLAGFCEIQHYTLRRCATPYCYFLQVIPHSLLESRAAGADASYLVAIGLGKPEIAIGSGCDLCWVLLAVGTGNSVIVPLGLMRPILLPMNSVNQRLPWGPAVIPSRPLLYGTGNSLMLAAREA